ncbi:MAG: tRNA1(Val) (adenine(37)-N6)-methyltransferase [Nitrospirae bacterium]|nr:MAG: tRNA1(Val) (adenine(37)-N6)-methyltransferase [Nitrospirota bacterium]
MPMKHRRISLSERRSRRYRINYGFMFLKRFTILYAIEWATYFNPLELTLDTIRDLKLYQNKKGYRFSVDALLLYSFVNLRRAGHIADLGAGSGVIGLLLARKYHDSTVTLIELQESLAGLAKKNAKLNSLDDRVAVIESNITNIAAGRSPLLAKSFDLVVSNPPFRRQNTGLISPTDEKAIARHEIKLKIKDLIDASFYLLRAKGRLCIIYHPSRLVELIDALRKKQLEPKRLRLVHSNTNTEAKMVLVEAIKEGKAEMKIEKPMYIYNENGQYRDEMKQLYRAY